MTCSQPSRHLSITWDRNNNPWLFHLVIELQIDHHRPRSPSLWINYFFIGSTICGWHKWFGFICRHPLNLATLDTCWWLRNRVIKKSLILKMKLNDKRWFQNPGWLLLLFITQEQILKLDETTSSFKGEKKPTGSCVCDCGSIYRTRYSLFETQLSKTLKHDIENKKPLITMRVALPQTLVD